MGGRLAGFSAGDKQCDTSSATLMISVSTNWGGTAGPLVEMVALLLVCWGAPGQEQPGSLMLTQVHMHVSVCTARQVGFECQCCSHKHLPEGWHV